MAVLENSGFELPPDGESIVGWQTNATMGGSVALDTQQNAAERNP